MRVDFENIGIAKINGKSNTEVLPKKLYNYNYNSV